MNWLNGETTLYKFPSIDSSELENIPLPLLLPVLCVLPTPPPPLQRRTPTTTKRDDTERGNRFDLPFVWQTFITPFRYHPCTLFCPSSLPLPLALIHLYTFRSQTTIHCRAQHFLLSCHRIMSLSSIIASAEHLMTNLMHFNIFPLSMHLLVSSSSAAAAIALQFLLSNQLKIIHCLSNSDLQLPPPLLPKITLWKGSWRLCVRNIDVCKALFNLSPPTLYSINNNIIQSSRPFKNCSSL